MSKNDIDTTEQRDLIPRCFDTCYTDYILPILASKPSDDQAIADIWGKNVWAVSHSWYQN